MAQFDMTALVTDRTPADAKARNAKGTYNATDLNRVEAATGYVSERVNEDNPVKDYAEAQGVAWDQSYDPAWEGVTLTPVTKTDWEMTDFPTEAEMARYLGNVETLRETVPAAYPTLPESMARLDTAGANAIEQSLITADGAITAYATAGEDMVDRIKATYPYCGEFDSGVLWTQIT